MAVETDFVKLISNGYAVFRPNLVIQRQAESIPDPASMDQSTQTDDDCICAGRPANQLS